MPYRQRIELMFGLSSGDLIHPYPAGENGHHFIGPSGGEGFAPVIGLGVVELVEQGDGVADGGEAAEQGVVDGFVLVFGQDGDDGRWVGCALGVVLKHGSGSPGKVWAPSLSQRGVGGRKART